MMASNNGKIVIGEDAKMTTLGDGHTVLRLMPILPVKVVKLTAQLK